MVVLGLQPGTTYTYAIVAYDDVEKGSLSNNPSSQSAPTGIIRSASGRVTDASGNGIGEVMISDNVGHHVASLANGNYTLSGLAPGT